MKIVHIDHYEIEKYYKRYSESPGRYASFTVKDDMVQDLPKEKIKVMHFPSLVTSPIDGHIGMSGLLHKTEKEAKDYYTTSFVRWLNEEKFGVEIEIYL